MEGIDFIEGVKIIGVIILILTFVGGIVYKFSSLTNSAKNNKEKLTEHIEEQEEDFEKMCGDLSLCIRKGDHSTMCQASTETLCRKLEDNKKTFTEKIEQSSDESKKFWKLLQGKVETIEADIKEDRAASHIFMETLSKFMGGIEERNKLIDAERAKRRSSDG